MSQRSDNAVPKLIDRYKKELELHLDMRPLSKNTRKKVRDKAREYIQTSYEESINELRRADRWPAEQDSLTIDITVFADNKNSPRIDNVCKWFLDELEGPTLIYRNDRQIKLLFAKNLKAESGGFVTDEGKQPSTFNKPRILLKARRLDHVRAEIQQAAEANLNDPHDEMAESSRELLSRLDNLIDTIEAIEVDNQVSDQENLSKLKEERRYTNQLLNLRTVDNNIENLFANGIFDRPQYLARWLSSLTQLPYVFNLGPLPDHGASAAFEQATESLLAEARNNYAELFPLHLPVGLTVFYFETGDGKDLDNLVRTILPDILDAFEPPSAHVLFSPTAPETGSDIEFLEAVALPSNVENIEPGTVLFALSEGARSASWWEKVTAEHFNAW